MTQYFPRTTNSMSRYLGQFTVKSGYNEWPRCRHVFFSNRYGNFNRDDYDYDDGDDDGPGHWGYHILTHPYPTLDDGWKSFLGQKFRLNRSKIRSTPVLPLLLLLFFKQMFLANGDRLSVRSAIGFAHMAHGMGWLLEVWISAVVSF